MTRISDNKVREIVKTVFPDAEIYKEFRFCKSRKWRFDYAVMVDNRKIAIEIEGGVWVNGRHVRGAGYVKDIEKYNTASACGWIILRAVPSRLEELAKYFDMIKGAENEQAEKAK